MNPGTATPWGWPDQTMVTVDVWAQKYAPWIGIGLLVILAFATKDRK